MVATKVGGPTSFSQGRGELSKTRVRQEVDASLARLKTDYIDLLQLYCWDYQTPIEETLEVFDSVVQAGKVRYVGASSMWGWQLLKMLKLQDAQGWSRFVSIQLEYNPLYGEAEQ